MNVNRFLITLIAVVFGISIVRAQDVIVKKDGTAILCKVTTVTLSTIEYKQWSDLEGPLYSIKQNELISINYENGEIENYKDNYDMADEIDLPVDGIMGRNGRFLTLNERKLTKEEVFKLFNEENYKKYRKANGNLLASHIGDVLFYSFFGTTVGMAAVAVERKNDNKTTYAVVSGIFTVVSYFISRFLGNEGENGLNQLVYEYNNIHYKKMSYSLTPALINCENQQLQTNYALGMTFSVNF